MTTTFLIGVDEAGYGPNLGPLVVAATVWQLDKDFQGQAGTNGRNGRTVDFTRMDWHKRLADRISRTADENRVAVADSKSLYSPAAGLKVLEEGVLAALRACNANSSSWIRLIDALQADPDRKAAGLPWHNGWDEALPVEACPARVERLSQALLQCRPPATRSAQRPHIALHSIHAVVVHPAEFNRLTSESNKATALSQISLRLLGRVFEALPREDDQPQSAVAVCDKHGGRDYYAPLLVEAFAQTLVQVQRESRSVSRYRFRLASTSADVSFRCKGERFLPTALASMTAKYVRELSMRALNEFWRQRVTGLRPTAGYPVDSYRFKRDIASAQRELGIDDNVLWRNR